MNEDGEQASWRSCLRTVEEGDIIRSVKDSGKVSKRILHPSPRFRGGSQRYK